MNETSLFTKHIRHLYQHTMEILDRLTYDALVISSGGDQVYFADDRHVAFHPTPHFAHWCFDAQPFHLLCILPQREKPLLVYYHPEDFWHEVTQPDPLLAEHFELIQESNKDKCWSHIPTTKHLAFIGPTDQAPPGLSHGTRVSINPGHLVAALDWNRCTKSAYEIECLKTANQIASQGHKAVRACFEADQTATEHSLHLEFLKATQQTESALPYNTIVGLNEKSAMLHYQKKRISYHPPQVLLIDAGVSYKGYASDITRTYAKPTLVHGVFSELLTSLNALQLSLCHATQAEVSFVDLHVQCHQGIAQLLLDQGILRGCSTESALAQGLTSLFLPHGLGHMLGLQVHDVGGTQLNAQGDRCPLHPTYPKLRMNRPLRENEVVTIEPGLYFIPLLLEAKRHTPEAKHIHWPLIEVLYPYGGIRIEDDLWVQSGSRENLTRSYLP